MESALHENSHLPSTTERCPCDILENKFKQVVNVCHCSKVWNQTTCSCLSISARRRLKCHPHSSTPFRLCRSSAVVVPLNYCELKECLKVENIRIIKAICKTFYEQRIDHTRSNENQVFINYNKNMNANNKFRNKGNAYQMDNKRACENKKYNKNKINFLQPDYSPKESFSYCNHEKHACNHCGIYKYASTDHKAVPSKKIYSSRIFFKLKTKKNRGIQTVPRMTRDKKYENTDINYSLQSFFQNLPNNQSQDLLRNKLKAKLIQSSSLSNNLPTKKYSTFDKEILFQKNNITRVKQPSRNIAYNNNDNQIVVEEIYKRQKLNRKLFQHTFQRHNYLKNNNLKISQCFKEMNQRTSERSQHNEKSKIGQQTIGPKIELRKCSVKDLEGHKQLQNSVFWSSKMNKNSKDFQKIFICNRFEVEAKMRNNNRNTTKHILPKCICSRLTTNISKVSLASNEYAPCGSEKECIVECSEKCNKHFKNKTPKNLYKTPGNWVPFSEQKIKRKNKNFSGSFQTNFMSDYDPVHQNKLKKNKYTSTESECQTESVHILRQKYIQCTCGKENTRYPTQRTIGIDSHLLRGVNKATSARNVFDNETQYEMKQNSIGVNTIMNESKQTINTNIFKSFEFNNESLNSGVDKTYSNSTPKINYASEYTNKLELRPDRERAYGNYKNTKDTSTVGFFWNYEKGFKVSQQFKNYKLKAVQQMPEDFPHRNSLDDIKIKLHHLNGTETVAKSKLSNKNNFSYIHQKLDLSSKKRKMESSNEIMFDPKLTLQIQKKRRRKCSRDSFSNSVKKNIKTNISHHNNWNNWQFDSQSLLGINNRSRFWPLIPNNLSSHNDITSLNPFNAIHNKLLSGHSNNIKSKQCKYNEKLMENSETETLEKDMKKDISKFRNIKKKGFYSNTCWVFHNTTLTTGQNSQSFIPKLNTNSKDLSQDYQKNIPRNAINSAVKILPKLNKTTDKIQNLQSNNLNFAQNKKDHIFNANFNMNKKVTPFMSTFNYCNTCSNNEETPTFYSKRIHQSRKLKVLPIFPQIPVSTNKTQNSWPNIGENVNLQQNVQHNNNYKVFAETDCKYNIFTNKQNIESNVNISASNKFSLIASKRSKHPMNSVFNCKSVKTIDIKKEVHHKKTKSTFERIGYFFKAKIFKNNSNSFEIINCVNCLAEGNNKEIIPKIKCNDKWKGTISRRPFAGIL